MKKISPTDPTLSDEISQMIVSIIGDYKTPLPETIYLIGHILKRQIKQIILKAESVSDIRHSKTIELEDFIFVLRNNQIRLKRLHDFLAFDRSVKNLEGENFENLCLSSSKKARVKDQFGKFVNDVVDNRNGVIQGRIIQNNPVLIDPIRQKQINRLDKQYKEITDEQYVELANLRHSSFRNLSHRGFRKLKTCLKLEQFKPMSEMCGEVIGFLFREILNEIVEISVEIKDKQTDTKVINSKRRSGISSNEIFESYRVYANESESARLKKYVLL